METKGKKELLLSTTESLARVSGSRSDLARALDTGSIRRSVDRAAKPKSLAGGMKKVGVVLCASPDPITDIPGVALLASAHILKHREPAGLEHLAKETRRVLREIHSLRI